MNVFIMPQSVNAIDSGAVLGFSTLGGGVIRVTRSYYDPFDATFDHEVLEGDFLYEDLRAALEAFAPKAGRPSRRKPRRWWRRG